MPEIITREKPPPLSLERAGFRLPSNEISLQRAVFAALKEYTEKNSTAPRVTFHRGQPPLSTDLSDQQFTAFELKEELTALEGITGKVATWIKDTLMPKIALYSDEEEYKNHVRNTFASSFSLDQIAVVYGNENRAIDLIHQVMTKSVGSNVSLLKRNYPPKSPEDEVLIRTGIKSELENQNYIHLVIQDSSQIMGEQRKWIKERLQNGHCFVTDIVTSKYNAQKSLAADQDIADLVFTVDATTSAQLYGINAIFGNQKAIDALQRIHKETIGTLPSTAMEMRLLVEDENFRTQLQSLSPEQIDAIPNSSLAQVVSILRDYATLQYSDNPDQKDQARSNLNSFISLADRKIKQQLREFYFPDLPDEYSEHIILASGGARGLLSASERYFFEKDEVDTIAVLSPHWPYKDVFKNARIVTLDNCLDENGEIRIDVLEQKLKPLGEKIALMVESGGRLPDSNVYTLASKQALIQLGAELNIQLWEDAAFHRIVYGDHDKSSFLEVAYKMKKEGKITKDYLRKLTTFWSGSKHLGTAGTHFGATISLRDDLLKYLESDISPKPDALSLHITHNLTNYSNLTDREAKLLGELRKRMSAVDDAVAQRSMASATKPKGAYFSILSINSPKVQNLTKSQSDRLALYVAREYGVGFLFEHFYRPNLQNSDLVEPKIRITAGGDINPDEMKKQVLNLIDTIVNLSDDEIAAIK